MGLDTYSPLLRESKRKTFIATLMHRISHAELMADTYRMPTSGLNNLKQKVELEWKNLPFYEKVLATFIYLIIPTSDPRRKIGDEIEFRNSGGIRGPEEWKQPFRDVANRYKKDGLEEVSVYILNEVLPEYPIDRAIFEI